MRAFFHIDWNHIQICCWEKKEHIFFLNNDHEAARFIRNICSWKVRMKRKSLKWIQEWAFKNWGNNRLANEERKKSIAYRTMKKVTMNIQTVYVYTWRRCKLWKSRIISLFVFIFLVRSRIVLEKKKAKMKKSETITWILHGLLHNSCARNLYKHTCCDIALFASHHEKFHMENEKEI